jgi:hypothetical protein
MEGSDAEEESPDERIRALIHARRPAHDADISAIVERMASAPFSTRDTPVPRRMRLRYLGLVLGARADSLSLHLVKRVVIDQQWSVGTNADDYMGDCHRAARDPAARLVLFHDWGGDFAATISVALDAVPASRLGPRALPLLFVAYSADDATLRTAYMFSTLALLRLPEDALWLK